MDSLTPVLEETYARLLDEITPQDGERREILDPARAGGMSEPPSRATPTSAR